MTALRITQLSQDGQDWYARYLVGLDSGNLEDFRPFMHDDCIMQINNNLPLYGANVILGALKRNWETFERVEHEPVNIYGSDAAFCAEMLWRFTCRDGKVIAVPAASFVERGPDGTAVSIRLYANLGPIFE